jgi:PAS domain-containing protein
MIRTLRLLWIAVVAALLGTATLALAAAPGATAWVALGTAAVGACAWTYISIRLLTFQRGLTGFLRNLIAVNYETGIRTSSALPDEVTALTALCNQLAENLRAFDALCGNRIALSHRALDLVHQLATDPILLLYIDRQALQLNHAFQALMGCEKRRFAFEAVKSISGNAPFFSILAALVEERGGDMQAETRLRLPGGHEAVALRLRFTPIKDGSEKVQVVVAVALPAGAPGAGW